MEGKEIGPPVGIHIVFGQIMWSHNFQHIYNNTIQYCYSKGKK